MHVDDDTLLIGGSYVVDDDTLLIGGSYVVDDDTLLIGGSYVGTTLASSIFCSTYLNKLQFLGFQR